MTHLHSLNDDTYSYMSHVRAPLSRNFVTSLLSLHIYVHVILLKKIMELIIY
jgi:hypothetical protein